MKYLFLSVPALGLMMSSCAPAAQLTQPTKTPTTPENETIIATATELPESSESTIGYTSVAEALADLQTRTDVSVEVKDGWTIVTESGGLTIWSFAPLGDPAYPALAKRVLYQDQGAWYLKMDVKCEADKASCDQFVRNFETLNEQMIKAINNRP